MLKQFNNWEKWNYHRGLTNIESISNDSIVVSVSNLCIGTLSVFEKEVSTTIEAIGVEFDNLETLGSILTVRGKLLGNVGYIYLKNNNSFSI